MSARSVVVDAELADTIEAERPRRKPPLKAVPDPGSPGAEALWTGAEAYARVRAACCDVSGWTTEEIDEHAARIVLTIIRVEGGLS